MPLWAYFTPTAAFYIADKETHPVHGSRAPVGVWCVRHGRNMIIATRYTVERVEGSDVFKIHNRDAPLCPSCRSLCSGYDTRPRRVIGDDGRAVVYRLRRVRCLICDVLHVELPDFMRPRKRYTGAVIDAVLGGRGECCPADDRTIRRWICENRPPAMSGVSGGCVVQSTYSDKKGDEP